MGKKKSAVCLFFLSLLIVVLCFFSTVSFAESDGITFWNSTVAMTAKDATLGGNLIDGESYYGGGYSAVYYPEGVISSKQYEADVAVLTGEARDEYVDKYVSCGSLWLDREKVCDGGNAATEDFVASFDAAVKTLTARYEALHAEGVRVDVADGYTVRVFLPQSLVAQTTGTKMDAQGNVFWEVFSSFSQSGEFTVSYGSDVASATKLMPESKRGAVITDYVKSASVRTGADGTTYIVVDFTKAGREVLKNATAEASSSTLYFNIGDSQAISLTVSEQIDQDTLFISGGALTGRLAEARAILIDKTLKGEGVGLSFTVGDYYRHDAAFGNNALLLVYIAFAVCFLAMMIFFFVRYGLLGFAHLFSFLIFFFSMLYCVWAIPFLAIGVGTVVALLMASVILSVSNAVAYEYARKEYAQGKTIASSVKNGYKKCFWHIFDLHIVIAALSFVMYGIALTGLSSFAFVLGLGTVFSGICSLAINRLCWATMMAFTNRKGAFCRFKRVEVEDD